MYQYIWGFSGDSDSRAGLQCGRLGFDPWVWEKEMATHSSILAWKIYRPWGRKELGVTEDFTFYFLFCQYICICIEDEWFTYFH